MVTFNNLTLLYQRSLLNPRHFGCLLRIRPSQLSFRDNNSYFFSLGEECVGVVVVAPCLRRGHVLFSELGPGRL